MSPSFVPVLVVAGGQAIGQLMRAAPIPHAQRLPVTRNPSVKVRLAERYAAHATRVTVRLA